MSAVDRQLALGIVDVLQRLERVLDDMRAIDLDLRELVPLMDDEEASDTIGCAGMALSGLSAALLLAVHRTIYMEAPAFGVNVDDLMVDDDDAEA